MKGERIPTLTEFLHMAEIMKATHTLSELEYLELEFCRGPDEVVTCWECVPLLSYVARAASGVPWIPKYESSFCENFHKNWLQPLLDTPEPS